MGEVFQLNTKYNEKHSSPTDFWFICDFVACSLIVPCFILVLWCFVTNPLCFSLLPLLQTEKVVLDPKLGTFEVT